MVWACTSVDQTKSVETPLSPIKPEILVGEDAHNDLRRARRGIAFGDRMTQPRDIRGVPLSAATGHPTMRAYNRGGRWQPRRGRAMAAHRGYESGHDNTAFLLQDLDAQVTTFSADSARYTSQPVVRISELKPITSYSWIDAPTPTIAVPGSPWIWASERAPVKQVPLDSGVQFIHHDASKMGDSVSPMLPLFAAIDAMHDDFAYKDLDFVTDRNSLRKLLRYIDNIQFRTDFRIDVDLVNKTCLFTRREENAAVEWQGGGYGHEYLKATTKAPRECEKMLDHHRAITYKFGRLNILLGCTVDARREPQLDDEDEFLSSFSSLSIRGQGAAETKANIKSFGGLNVQLTSPRSLVPQSDLIEVKTRSIYRELDWKDIYPQVYLSQTEWLYVAKHDKGLFQPVERISLKSEAMRPHAEEVEVSLGKLKTLLEDISRAVRGQGEGIPLTLVCQGGKLSLWKRKKGTGKPLGLEITSKFKGKESALPLKA